MTLTKRFASSTLLGAGMLLVFVGFSGALGFTAIGIVASVAAIATLLYAGAAWFGALTPRQRRDPVIVFDRSLRIACGPAAGAHVAAQFPESMRRQIEAGCAAALTGQSARFTCDRDGDAVAFEAAAVRGADGTVAYGILVAGAAAPSAVAACTAS